MSTTIRLTRMGRRKRPYYRLVVVDSRTRRDGAFIENLGIYNPIPQFHECDLNAERAIHWLEQGADVSETARSLLRNEGILFRWHLQKTGVSAEEIDQKVEEFRAHRSKKTDRVRAERAEEEARKAKAYAESLAAKQTAKEAEEVPAPATAADPESAKETESAEEESRKDEASQ